MTTVNATFHAKLRALEPMPVLRDAAAVPCILNCILKLA